MFGTGYTVGYRPLPEREVFKKFAWFPVKTSSSKWIWRQEYYRISTYYDKDGRPPVKGLAWQTVLSKNEFLVWQITNPPQDTPVGKY